MSSVSAKKGWSEAQKIKWYNEVAQNRVRDYNKDVVSRIINNLPANTHHIERYGTLNVASKEYPLFSVSVGHFFSGNPNILITGGVHGYEPSGVEASLRFLEDDALKLSKEFNFVVYPCISPWSYEFDQRWNNNAEDPNRNFSWNKNISSSVDECGHVMNDIEGTGLNFSVCIDLHETPDRDIELRVMRSKRFDEPLSSDYEKIPQGYYLMLTQNVDPLIEGANKLINASRMNFGQSIIREVEKISPIAPESTVLGKANHGGVTMSPAVEGTMRNYLGQYSQNVAVTEVYPDHPEMNPEKSVQAQMASIHGALNFVRCQFNLRP